MSILRLHGATLAGAREVFPVVLVTGPRQAGKTTLLKAQAGDGADYISFDDPVQREVARRDPRALLDGRGARALILDEVQYVSELFPWIKMAVDREPARKGAFLLTGSQQFSLMAGVTESLAGRVAVIELLPFSILELDLAGPHSLAEFVWNGGYPTPALLPASRDLWLSSYLQTYIERDVRQLRDVSDLASFERFLGLVASRHGQELNFGDLCRDVGVSAPTAKAWISVLAASYVVTLLPPWHRNLGKRLIKAPKLYFFDPALVAWLTRLPSPDSALASPLGGALVEGIVVAETYKLFAAAGKRAQAWHWRSQDGMEVDMIIEVGGEIIPIEIKRTATPTPHHAEGLRRFKRLEPAAHAGFVVCDVAERTVLGHGVVALPWKEWSAELAGRLGLSLPRL